MVEAQLAYNDPPSPGDRLPELESPNWQSYGGVLLRAWKQLMSTPTAALSLEIVGSLIEVIRVFWSAQVSSFCFSPPAR